MGLSIGVASQWTSNWILRYHPVVILRVEVARVCRWDLSVWRKGSRSSQCFVPSSSSSIPFSRTNVMTITAGNGRRRRMLPSMGAILMSTDKKGAIKLIVLLLVLHGGKDLRLATPSFTSSHLRPLATIKLRWFYSAIKILPAQN